MPEKPAYSRSIFMKFFASNDADAVSWSDNVLAKIYGRGIIPKYIVRGENIEDADDEDYVSFWSAITSYFSWFVLYAKKIVDVYNTEELLYDYIRDKGLEVRPQLELEEMQTVISNMYDEYRKRGTKFVFEDASSFETVTDDMAGVHNLYGENNICGEFLRAINRYYYNEFKYNISSPTNFGWTLGSCSPMYRGTCSDYQLIKGYENTDYIADLSLYPLVNSSYVSIVNDPLVDKDVMKLECGLSTLTGFGNTNKNVQEKKIVIHNSLNYEITFQVLVENDAQIRFGVDFFDNFGNSHSSNYIDGTLSDTNFFTRTMTKNGIYIFVRGIVFGINEPTRSADDSVLEVGFGKHIRIPADATYMVPKVLLYNPLLDASKIAKIYDFKVRIADTVYSRGLVQAPNIIQLWARNNNGNYSNRYTELDSVIHPITGYAAVEIPLLEDFVKRYLIPYNSAVIFNWLSDPDYTASYDDSYDDSHEN